MRAKDILSTVDRIYEAATARAQWSTALTSLSDLVRADHSVMIGRGGGAPFLVSTRVDERDMTRAMTAQDHVDAGPFAPAAMPSGRVLVRAAIMPDHEYERTEHYNEVVRPLNGFHGLSAHQQKAESGFMLVMCRPRRARNFDAVDGRTLQSVISHLDNALALQARLHIAERRYTGLANAIDRLDCGVILTDTVARPVQVNARAARIIDAFDGLLLTGARLSAATPAVTRRLHQAIGMVAADNSAASRQLHIERPSRRLPLILNLCPVARLAGGRSGTGTASVAIFITEPDAPAAIEQAAFAEIFRLTRRESEAALLLAGGLDLDAIAARLDMGVGTVRSHLKSVYEKTGARSQAALVALLRGFAGPGR
jgi:DNA-binding CsgD family transcriptional regulator/PAS domain-containing protein